MNYAKISPLMLSLLLAACGGGGGSDKSSGSPTGTNNSSSSAIAAKTEVTQGMVTGFGSVIVNGIHYDMAGADINVDGKASLESDLKVGQIVRITGTVNADGKTGKATKLESESQLEGPISSIDLASGTLVALGQTLLLTADTFYDDNLTAAQLKVGDVIEVSSYLNSNGVQVVTRIDLEDDKDEKFQLAGNISNLDTTNRTFSINGTLVNYSGSNLAALTLSNGLRVRVVGNYDGSVFTAQGNLHASNLGFKHNDDDDFEIELSGTVANLVAGTSFTLDGITVLINNRTEYDDGVAANLVDGIQVKVEGRLDANQNLVAEEIDLNHQAKISNKGLLESVNLTTNTIVVNGLTFEVDANTSFNDRSKAKVRYFDIADLTTGDTLHVRGYKVAATASSPERNIATRIERHNPHAFGNDDWKLEVEGFVEAIGTGTITVAGQVVQVNELTRIEGVKTLDAFLAIALGLEVEVKAVTQNGVATAVEIEIEDDRYDD
ncbi:MAG: DUF5666 domain-containing protein [Cellvibrio sp.]|uniref:DUF5666 domain-containing protein n=1 Tax=Cellvibrio sp. TaxID=1965322 RepID=UPI0031A90F99